MPYRVAIQPSGGIFLEVPSRLFDSEVQERHFISPETARRLWLEIGDALAVLAEREKISEVSVDESAANSETKAK